MMPPRCKLWRLPRRAISRRSTSKEAGIANQTGRETSGSETGTVLSGTNARVLAEQFSSREHDAFRVPYLSDKAPEDEFHGQAVKTVA